MSIPFTRTYNFRIKIYILNSETNRNYYTVICVAYEQFKIKSPFFSTSDKIYCAAFERKIPEELKPNYSWTLRFPIHSIYFKNTWFVKCLDSVISECCNGMKTKTLLMRTKETLKLNFIAKSYDLHKLDAKSQLFSLTWNHFFLTSLTSITRLAYIWRYYIEIRAVFV